MALRKPQSNRIAFINTGWRDIDFYPHLSNQQAVQSPKLLQAAPKLYRPPQKKMEHMELVQYFHDVAYHSLVTLGSNTRIRDVLMHMALAHDTVSGQALISALLAFSSLRRAGLHHETMQFKVAQGLAGATQHVAACVAFFKAYSSNVDLFSEICDPLLDPRDPRRRDEGYTSRLRALEWSVRNFPASSSTSTALARPTTDLPFAVELYQTATLIYLARASQTPWEPLAKLESIIDRAFDGPIQAHACDHFFPLFALACEARTDEQRTSILSLLDRSEKRDHLRSMESFRAGIQSFWVQQDLYADGDIILNYLGLIKAIINSNKALPSFA
ncbi:putative Zn(2)-C6 fungal-type domain-containing protein [Seiridium unicorne]|uniref:Zn(2)-C6 fungal-type domain-containing protein n=1 Tax=Seiridium unicorne TaxID=138068 RepID=A0ABR2VAY6_9PEZI